MFSVAGWRRFAAVAFSYGGAVGILYVAEMVLSLKVPHATFGAYQLVRQVLPLIVLVALGGVDQAIPRKYSVDAPPRWVASWSSLLVLNGRAVVAAACVAAVLIIGQTLSLSYAAAIVLAAALIVVSEYCAACLRAADRLSLAALIQQAYRVALGLLLLLVLMVPQLPIPLLIVGASGIGAVIAVAYLRPSVDTPLRMARGGLRSDRQVGWPIGLSGLALGLGDYADILLLAWIGGGLAITGEYARWKLYLCYPFVAIASIVGFILLPMAVRALANAGGASKFSKSLTWSFWFGFPLVSLMLIAFVELLSPFPVPRWAIVLLVAGTLRLAYVLPSAILGAVAGLRSLRVYAVAALGSVVVEAMIILVGVSFMPSPWAASIGLLVATAARTGVSLGLVRGAKLLRLP